MKISLKKLIKKNRFNEGIIFFNESTKIRLCNIDGKKVNNYEALSELSLQPEEQQFIQKKWQETLVKFPEYYDGHVTAVFDIIFDKHANRLDFIMEKTRYSVVSHVYDSNYPNKKTAENFVGFGIGILVNLLVGKASDLLMVYRSQNIRDEKGAISIPGGNIEFKKSSCGKIIRDDIKGGLEQTAIKELNEEILANKFMNLPAKLAAISFEKKDLNKINLNVFFDVEAPEISIASLSKNFNKSEDKKESSGKFHLTNLAKKTSFADERNFYKSAVEIFATKKLQHSGFCAFTLLHRKQSKKSANYQELKTSAKIFNKKLAAFDFSDALKSPRAPA